MNTLCIIGARGGSKGVPGKNIRPIHGKPMIAWSIEQALTCPEISRLIVSTDHPEIARVAREWGAEVPFMRPPQLASDTASKWPVWRHALDFVERQLNWHVDLVVDLDCTNPLREVSDIQGAIAQIHRDQADGVLTICDAWKNPYFNMLEVQDGRLQLSKQPPHPVVCRQDAPQVFVQVASIYVFRPDYLRRANSLFEGRCTGYLVPPERSIDVDTEYDFKLVEFLMKERLEQSGARS